MAYVCDICKKGRMVGKTHRHHPGVAGKRWQQRAPKHQKVFKPNLHWTHIAVDGARKHLRLCTKCLRRAKEVMKVVRKEETSSQIPQATVGSR